MITTRNHPRNGPVAWVADDLPNCDDRAERVWSVWAGETNPECVWRAKGDQLWLAVPSPPCGTLLRNLVQLGKVGATIDGTAPAHTAPGVIAAHFTPVSGRLK